MAVTFGGYGSLGPPFASIGLTYLLHCLARRPVRESRGLRPPDRLPGSGRTASSSAPRSWGAASPPPEARGGWWPPTTPAASSPTRTTIPDAPRRPRCALSGGGDRDRGQRRPLRRPRAGGQRQAAGRRQVGL